MVRLGEQAEATPMLALRLKQVDPTRVERACHHQAKAVPDARNDCNDWVSHAIDPEQAGLVVRFIAVDPWRVLEDVLARMAEECWAKDGTASAHTRRCVAGK